MPLGLDPNATVDFWLRSDADKPEAERPTFVFHYLTKRQVRRYDELHTVTQAKGSDDADVDKAVNEMLAIGLVGWRNMGVEFDLAKLDDILTIPEKFELAFLYPEAVIQSERDLVKKFTSPSPSDGDVSAGVVATPEATASAQTPPQ